ncbi:MAG: adenylate/guanylate cyclase domain-containing protein [Spirochaetales bacterium]
MSRPFVKSDPPTSLEPTIGHLRLVPVASPPDPEVLKAVVTASQRALAPTFAVGVVLCLAGLAFDLSPWHRLVAVPVTPLVLLGYLVVGFALARRWFQQADVSTVELNQKLTDTELALIEAADAYSRFFPEQFLRHFERKSVAQVRLGDQVARGMTVMFADIRNFTAMSENLTPEENFRFLNDYYGRIGPVIREQYGFIDKYIGDAIMALFDGPVDEAIAAAVAIQLATADYNLNLKDQRFGPITIGVGLHSGPLMLGVIGEIDRMESTVIADAVNLASRIESLTKYYDCRILLTRSTFEAQSDPLPYMTRPVDLVRVKGRRESVELLEILDERFDPRAFLKRDLAAHLAEALIVYRRGEFQEARILFQRLAYLDPQDVLYGIYRRRTEEMVRLGKPEGWTGINEFAFK